MTMLDGNARLYFFFFNQLVTAGIKHFKIRQYFFMVLFLEMEINNFNLLVP
jgi:hypothetical protein